MDISTPATTIPLQKSYASLKALRAPKKVLWKKLAVATNDEIRFVPFEDIIYCMAASNYTTVYVRGGASYLCCKTLKDIEAKLPADTFLRIHQSYLVNLHCITSLKKQTGELEIDNHLMLPVSRNKKAELYALFNL